MAVVIGERYKRRGAPHDYVWVDSAANGSVGYRHAGGLANLPVERFEHSFEPCPKRRRKGGPLRPTG